MRYTLNMSNQVPLNWSKIGTALRESALEAHDGGLPPLKLAYEFMLDNPWLFIDQDVLDVLNVAYGDALTMAEVNIGNVEWPADMPQEPTAELMAAYYCVEVIR
jgi:hypothetical protein